MLRKLIYMVLGGNMFSSLLNRYLGVELLDHVVGLCLVPHLVEQSNWFPKWLYYFAFPPAERERWFHFLHILTSFTLGRHVFTYLPIKLLLLVHFISFYRSDLSSSVHFFSLKDSDISHRVGLLEANAFN